MKKSKGIMLSIALFAVLVLSLLFCLISPIGTWVLERTVFFRIYERQCHYKVWVQVVDQDDIDVPHYNMAVILTYFSLRTPYLKSQEIIWFKTDEAGKYYCDTRRRVGALTLGFPLEEEKRNKNHYLSINSVKNLAYQGQSIYQNNKDNPITVKVERHGPPEKLICIHQEEAFASYDDPFINIDVLQGTVAFGKAPSGHISITDVLSKPRSDGYRSLEAVEFYGGHGVGLQYAATRGMYVNAPGSGYQAKAVVPAGPATICFFKIEEGPIYGVVAIEYSFRDETTRKTRFRLTCKANPSGSANLYYSGYQPGESAAFDWIRKEDCAPLPLNKEKQNKEHLVPVSRRSDRGKRDEFSVGEVENGR